MEINNVVIVGGGTAGWLSANHLGLLLATNSQLNITLIESPNIPSIGVGEGTVPAIKKSFEKFGISETDLVRECDVTFKQSIKFANWLDKGKHGDNYYHHLFDYPFPFNQDLAPYWLAKHSHKNFSDYVSMQGDICDLNLAPKTILTPEYQGITEYAYHLDAKKLASFLAKHAVNHFGVRHVRTEIKDVALDEAGNIVQLITNSMGTFAVDMVIDCSGFSSYFLGGKLGVKYIDKSDQLLTDTALTVQVPVKSTEHIPSYTISTAHQSGWIWDIALTERRGVGLVYSAQHLSEIKAEEKLQKYVGKNLDHLDVRKIPMKVGYRESVWHKNCVAIGLSQGFVEPLEATSILLTDFSADLLAKAFPNTMEELPILSKRYNKRVIYAWERVIDFIKLHYCLSDRTDSDFWLDNKLPSTIPDSLLELLEYWKVQSPTKEDFFSKFEVFDVENYLYVLYGMKFNTKKPLLTKEYESQASQQILQLDKAKKQYATELPRHRELISKIKQYGLQKL